ncbi:uncharacterized protein LOC131303224 isoform X2 [Rhododendron vialii]|uniref:uncharacterized protein LOC131303224 isoform X2 n=1 Tax=Rhododendron vialii TaxID=182163 RepID=UPI00265DA292|nr:uncharacterized protein LOC131303224 isoform X2 [Rhododendron vialii]
MSITSKFLPLHLSLPNPNPKFPFPTPTLRLLSHPKPLTIRSAKKRQRTGNLRYPSEKKKLKSKQKTQIDEADKFEGFWRLYKLEVTVHRDPGKDFLGVSDALLEQIAKALKFPAASMLPPEAFSVVRKSFDARKFLKEPKFVYTVDMDVNKLLNLEPCTWDFIFELEPKVGEIEHLPHERVSGDVTSIIQNYRRIYNSTVPIKDGNNQHSEPHKHPTTKKPRVVVVGSGPSGLFASLVLAELGADVTLLERGQAVEQRGRDIGALVVRKILQLESNFCFGEVMKTLVTFGAPENILFDGKPHLGTDRLVPLLRNFRQYLQRLGVDIRFGTRVDDLLVENGNVVGVEVCDSRSNLKFNSQKLGCDAAVLAVGHSARDIYQMLLSHDTILVPKEFAVGLRIEHPQELINGIQYAELAVEVRSGRGRIPVADYKVGKYISGDDADEHFDSGPMKRSCYSFCMCPGGQVVLTTTNTSELCINGMSFSRRASKWANAALVVTVSSKDFESLNFHGPVAGVEFQREFERRAATMGGGNFQVPVQTVTDFLENKLSGASIPPSSYRLGVKAASLHELFPSYITEALQSSILTFENELPGFISSNALLHGVETRTSSPVKIPRSAETYECTSLKGLYPIGEGAGYAGGIVSAAVDGMYAGFALAKSLDLYRGSIESVFGKAKSSGFTSY